MSIMSYLQDYGIETRLLDCRELIHRHNTDDLVPIILTRIKDFRPDFIGISIVTAAFYNARRIVGCIRDRFPEITLIAGGAHPSVEPELTLEQIPGIDAVCIGPGEEVCLELAQGVRLDGIDGLMLRGSQEEYKKRPVETDIDKYPFPNYDLVETSFYTAMYYSRYWGCLSSSLSALTSRSCPYSCKFCASEWSRPFRYHSAEYVVELAKYLSRYDIHQIHFWDDTIAFDHDRLEAICQGFAESGLFAPHGRLRWSACMCAHQVKPELLRLMKTAGCYHVHMGIESGSDRILKAVTKRATVEMNRKACRYVQEAGLNLGITFMVGIPGETEQDIKATLQFVGEINGNTVLPIAYHPMPGSPLYQELQEKGIIDRNALDWNRTGDLLLRPDDSYCDVPAERLNHFFDQAQELSASNHRIFIHRDVAEEHKQMVRNVREYANVVVVDSAKDLLRTPWLQKLANWIAKIRIRLTWGWGIIRQNPGKLIRLPYWCVRTIHGKINSLLQHR
jgi:anaerobic magnesium-protoporphyrin IX monomethyl ester cyclase